ncbi:hypothetical protein H4R18_004600 [Coemansia javaensis]|uniref:Uncharacterized protein n=1 Tax=Coemansia javaensis TaxID=2761396 RepID=A0A9W8H4F4_9FUNG|nr:hypothetical protein H4R18_004600 [Coemansia javaensis]
MVFGWQKPSQKLRRRAPPPPPPAPPPPSVPPPIAEDTCEAVPQFFPGYEPRMTVVTAGPAPPSPLSPQSPQRRAGSVRLAVDAGARRGSALSSASSTATLLSPPLHGSMPQHQHQQPSAAVRRASTIASLQPLLAAPVPPGEEVLPARYSAVGEGRQGVTRSSSGSSARTLGGASSSSGPRAVHHALLKRIPLTHRSYHLPRRAKPPAALQRNNTTRTVSHNDLSADAAETRRLLQSRSTDFGDDDDEGDPAARGGAKAARHCAAAGGTALVRPLVESVYLDCSDADDIKIAARLVPRAHDAGGQLAYLPPRTSALAVANTPSP